MILGKRFWIIAGSLGLTAGVVISGVGFSSSLNSEPSAAPVVEKIEVQEKRSKPSKSPIPTPTPTPSPSASQAPVEASPTVVSQPAPPPGFEFVEPDAPSPVVEEESPIPPGFSYVKPVIVNLSASDIPSWIVFDVNNDNEQLGETEESWNSSLYAYYFKRFGQTYQYQPVEVHAHWWGDPEVSPSHDEIVSYIDRKDALTVNFVVSANRVTSMMPLSWMATTTGYRNPWGWKMEIDPRLTDEVYKTVAALMFVVESKNPHLGNEPIRLHKEFYATQCADLDIVYLRQWVDRFTSGEYDIETGQPAVVSSPSVSPSPNS